MCSDRGLDLSEIESSISHEKTAFTLDLTNEPNEVDVPKKDTSLAIMFKQLWKAMTNYHF